MVAPLNRKVSTGEFVGKQLDFYTVRSTVNFTPGNMGDAAQERLNKMIELISLRGQPVILSVEPSATETDPDDLESASGAVTVYTLKFAIEHAKAWETTPSLKDTLVAAGIGFAAGTISVTYHDLM